MERSVSLRRCAARVAPALALALCASSAARAESSAQPVKAVWQVQEIYLSYLGFTSKYSCDGMRDRVEGWMKQLGVHDSVVRVAGCDRATGPANLPSVSIVMATPVAATPQALAANAQDKKRSELLTKLQRKGKPALVDGTFDATRKTVVLYSKETMSPGSAGDCELLENLRDQVIKKIDAHVLNDNLRCTPHQGTVGNPQLEVDLLSKA